MTILFYPDTLKANSRLYWACKQLNIQYHNDLNKSFDVCFYCSHHKRIAQFPSELKSVENVLNKNWLDVTKTRIGNIFDNIAVDPEKYDGLVVRKSERQCSMDETLLQCPTKREDGYIYRKLIDTKIDGHYIDYRLFVFGKEMFLASKKSLEAFLVRGRVIWKLESLSLLLQEKIKQILISCAEYGMDFGELDLLRDKDGQFYITDCNNIAGTGLDWKKDHAELVREQYLEHFKRFLEKHKNI